MPTRAQVNKVDEHQGGNTNLMRAALDGDLESVKLLAASGAQVNERNNEGRTPLMFAAINRHTESAKELLAQGADANAKADDGGTALMLAASSGDKQLVQLLLAHGADASNKYYKTGQTAITIAREHGFDDIVQLLQEAEARQQPEPKASSAGGHAVGTG